MMDERDLYKEAAGGAPDLGHIKGEPAPQITGPANHEPEERIDSGIIILPPVADEENPELDSYPEDYVKYCQERMRAYKKANGELPAWTKKEDMGEDNAIEVDT